MRLFKFLLSTIFTILLFSCQMLQGPDAIDSESKENDQEVMKIVSPSLENILENYDNKTIQIFFNKNPGTVVVDITSSSASITVSPTSLNFDSGNYTVPQNVTVSPINDANFDNELGVSIEIKLSGAVYKTFAASTIDNDKKTFDFRIVDSVASGMDSVGGISGIDAMCNASSDAISLGGTYKAMISDGANRQATVGSQIDWVFKPHYTYYQNDDFGKEIFTANSDGVFDFGGGNLTNPFTTDGVIVATGLNADWSTNAGNCAGWTSASAGSTTVGANSQLDSTSINNNTYSCTTPNFQVICVQQ